MTLGRRQFLQTGTGGVAAALLTSAWTRAMTPTSVLRIAFLHLAPRPSDLVYNRQLVERAVTIAAGLGAEWILTPELCICGYTFAEQIGADWILSQPDLWMREFCQLVARRHVAVFLSHPERDPQIAKLHNSVFVIAANGAIIGKHRKINMLRVGAESWLSPGEQVAPVLIPPLSRRHTDLCGCVFAGDCAKLTDPRVELLVSSAAWAPGLHGPDGEWERCPRDTGLSLLVCNRTGPDQTLKFTEAESVIVQGGQRLLSFRADRSAIFTIEWNLQTQSLVTPEYQTVYL